MSLLSGRAHVWISAPAIGPYLPLRSSPICAGMALYEYRANRRIRSDFHQRLDLQGLDMAGHSMSLWLRLRSDICSMAPPTTCSCPISTRRFCCLLGWHGPPTDPQPLRSCYGRGVLITPDDLMQKVERVAWKSCREGFYRVIVPFVAQRG